MLVHLKSTVSSLQSAVYGLALFLTWRKKHLSAPHLVMWPAFIECLAGGERRESLIWTRNGSGQRTEPKGTPQVTSERVELSLPTRITKVRSARKLFIKNG